MNNQPGQHPLYQLGQPGAIQLNMDNIFAAAAEQNAGVHKPATIIPQYAAAYPGAAEMHLHHHTAPALNLSQPHILVQQTEPAHQTVIAYPEAQHQQQPISFKTTVAAAAPTPTQATVVAGTAQPVRTEPTHEQPTQDKKKDIVAEAASKIFEDDGAGGATAGKKPADAPTTSSGATTEETGPPITAIKSEPGTSGTSAETTTTTKSTDTKPTVRPVQSRGRGGRGRGGYSSSQITPRLSLLDDEDDGLTCRMCLQSFWYKTHLLEHLKDAHSISEPDRYEREERERRLRRIREVQQRRMVAQRQYMGGRGGRGGRGRGRPPVITRPAGPRPSFQYRDGAFICDLCKKSFSDGNDMVTHWKSHVKQQRLAGPPMGKRGRPGRPPSSYYSSSGRPVRGKGGRGLGRADKGKPRWTAYLVWSTKRRRDLTAANPDLTFAEVAKKISEQWKQVGADEREDLQEKAEDMNFRGVRKARPKDREVESESSETDWTSDEDPDFEDKLVKIKFKKEIKREIKREKLEYGEEGYGEEGLDDLNDDDDEISSDDASEMPSVPRKPRSARQRKRPSFFQEFEDEENNLDKILEDYELEQIEEAKKPREEKPKPKPRDPNAPPRKRRQKRAPEPEEMPEEVELETSRSGRIRKKTRFNNYFEPEEGEVQGVDASDNDDEDDGEFKPGSDVEELEKEDDKVSSSGSEAETEDDSIDDIDDMHEFNRPPKEGTSGLSITKIPIKKKKRKKKRALMTDAEIEAATKAAMEKTGEGKEEGEAGSGSEYTTDDSGEEGEANDKGGKSEVKGEKSKDGVVVAKKSAPPPPAEDGDAETAADKDKEAPSSGAADAQSNEGSQGGKAAAESEAAPTAAEPDAAASEKNPLQDEEAAAAEENPLGDVADEGEGDGEANPLDDADKEDESSSANPLGDIPDDPMDTSETATAAAVASESQDGDKSGSGGGGGAVSEETPAEAETEEDLLTSAASSKMEEGDDKFKDIIAEGQIDNIFN